MRKCSNHYINWGSELWSGDKTNHIKLFTDWYPHCNGKRQTMITRSVLLRGVPIRTAWHPQFVVNIFFGFIGWPTRHLGLKSMLQDIKAYRLAAFHNGPYYNIICSLLSSGHQTELHLFPCKLCMHICDTVSHCRLQHL